MRVIEGHDGQPVRIRYSRGPSSVPYLEHWEDNVLPCPGGLPWPQSLLRQVRGYVARRNWFSEDDAEALAAHLGWISRFQSLNSEDAVTWSWFGTLGCAGADDRRSAVRWLYDRLGLRLSAAPDVSVGQWMRVVHPNAARNGPELDARIDDPGAALTYVEAKWNAELGFGTGAVKGERDDQVVLRRDSLRVDPALRSDSREFLVLGVSNVRQDLSPYDEQADQADRAVRVAWLTWQDLAECDAHPLAADFRRYLRWRIDIAAGRARNHEPLE